MKKTISRFFQARVIPGEAKQSEESCKYPALRWDSWASQNPLRDFSLRSQ